MRLWRMLKYMVVFLLIAGALVWLYNHNGTVTLEWLGYRADVEMLFFLPALAVVVFAIIVVDRFMRWLVNLPERLAERSATKKRDKAYRAIMEGFTAISAGDIAAAKKLSQQSEKLFSASKEEAAPLSLLLAAQTAQMEGDEREAQKFYRQMLSHESAEFLGLRGLLVSSMRRIPATASPVNETLEEALSYAERGYALRPHTRWLVLALVELYVKSGRWLKADRLVERAYKQRVLEEMEADRLLAIVHYHQAQSLLDKSNVDDALVQAESAHRKRLAFVPATVLLTDILIRQTQHDKAIKVIEKSWPLQPHPLLSKRYMSLIEKMPAEKRIKRIEKMVKQVPEHVESQLLVARAAIDGRLWSKARNHLKSALSVEETVKVCRMMAELEDRYAQMEEGNADENLAEQWYERSHDAKPDARWVCGNCGNEHERWVVVCNGCGGFDTVRWAVPGVHATSEALSIGTTAIDATLAELPPTKVA